MDLARATAVRDPGRRRPGRARPRAHQRHGPRRGPLRRLRPQALDGPRPRLARPAGRPAHAGLRSHRAARRRAPDRSVRTARRAARDGVPRPGRPLRLVAARAARPPGAADALGHRALALHRRDSRGTPASRTAAAAAGAAAAASTAPARPSRPRGPQTSYGRNRPPRPSSGSRAGGSGRPPLPILRSDAEPRHRGSARRGPRRRPPTRGAAPAAPQPPRRIRRDRRAVRRDAPGGRGGEQTHPHGRARGPRRGADRRWRVAGRQRRPTNRARRGSGRQAAAPDQEVPGGLRPAGRDLETAPGDALRAGLHGSPPGGPQAHRHARTHAAARTQAGHPGWSGRSCSTCRTNRPSCCTRSAGPRAGSPPGPGGTRRARPMRPPPAPSWPGACAAAPGPGRGRRSRTGSPKNCTRRRDHPRHAGRQGGTRRRDPARPLPPHAAAAPPPSAGPRARDRAVERRRARPAPPVLG